MSITPRTGDKCWAEHGKRHYCICTGHDENSVLWAVHDTEDGEVVHGRYDRFAQGRVVYLEKRAAPGHEIEVARRALALVGHRLDLQSFDSQHLADYVINGKRSTPQLQTARVLAGGAAFGLWALDQIGAADGGDG